jgi:hypothetical protein
MERLAVADLLVMGRAVKEEKIALRRKHVKHS